MLRKLAVVLFILLSVSVSNAIETAERIRDREIIEGLATIKEGQKAMNQRFDESRGFMIWGFGVTFAGMWTLIGFVLWDRRSALAPAIRKNKELEEREEKLEKALKRAAVQDLKLAEALRYVGLL